MSSIDMYLRIQKAMPDDQEVQEMCGKVIQRHLDSILDKESKKRAVLDALREFEQASAKQVANALNSDGVMCGTKQVWSTQGAGWYLRLLVKEDAAMDLGGQPKVYTAI